MGDTKTSALTAVTTPAGTDEFAVNQAGTSKKMTITQVEDFVFISHSYMTGTITVLTGNFVLMTQHVILTTTQRLTLQGTARLRIN